MRHGDKVNNLGRTASHRAAMLSNMATSLIMHKRIFTTLAKAKALRGYVEPMITKSKEDTTHNRRLVFSFLQEKDAIKELFGVVSDKVADRPGGYTRIIKMPRRQGDAADMAMIELVDFNEIYTKDAVDASKKTRRSRRGASTTRAKKTTEKAAVTEETPTQETPAADAPSDTIDTATDATPETPEAPAKEDESGAAKDA